MTTEKIHPGLSLIFNFTNQVHNMAVKFGLSLCLSVNLFVHVTSAAADRESQSYSQKVFLFSYPEYNGTFKEALQGSMSFRRRRTEGHAGQAAPKTCQNPAEPIVVGPCFNTSECIFRVLYFTATTEVVAGGVSALFIHFVAITAQYTSSKKVKFIVK